MKKPIDLVSLKKELEEKKAENRQLTNKLNTPDYFSRPQLLIFRRRKKILISEIKNLKMVIELNEK